MSNGPSNNIVNGHPDRLPTLTTEERDTVLHWARRAKGGEQIKMYGLNGALVGVPIERGDLERATHQAQESS